MHATEAEEEPQMPPENQPAGGFDDTPIPWAPPGYTLKFTFHRANNLPFADFNSFSSDPYIVAQLITDLPRRHKQDPLFLFRTPTVRRDTNPVWEAQWIVANVPASGFYLKCRIYDEDPADHDDRLGNVHVVVDGIDDGWEGIHQQAFPVRKRSGSKRAYAIRSVAAALSRNRKLDAELILSVECLGRTEGDNGGQMYTVGPMHWFKHFSPLIGRLVGTSAAADDHDGSGRALTYNFPAVQMQLRGPVPSVLYHRYVEFRPFVAGMFTSKTLRGRILNRALHHQHARIYNFDRSTLYGQFPEPSVDVTRHFLEFVDYGRGGRIFTYVLTLDGQFRFTETGKEFGIDLLSKHTMHSDVSIYIAFSGEFFVRRRKHHHRANGSRGSNSTEEEADSSKDPSMYELIIDNDSGTYRPNGTLLPVLREFLSSNFPELHITTLDCQADADRMNRLKEERRQIKAQSRAGVVYLQPKLGSESSLSSSDEEEMAIRAGQPGKARSELRQQLHDAKNVKDRYRRWLEEQP